jgi:hypothetical protein
LAKARHDQAAKRHLRNAIKAHIRQILRDLYEIGIDIDVDREGFTLKNVSPYQAEEIRKYLSSVAFRKREVDLWTRAVQLDFSDLDKGWN